MLVMLRKPPKYAFALTDFIVFVTVISLIVCLALVAATQLRGRASQVRCLANLGRLSIATIDYCNHNAGLFPGPAGTGPLLVKAKDPHSSWDWIAYHYKAPTTQRLQDSAIAPYIRDGSGAPDLESVFRCPMDNLELHRTEKELGGNERYLYSYTMNMYMTSRGKMRRDGVQGKNILLARELDNVRSRSTKILFVEEDSRSIDDGNWSPGLKKDQPNSLSDRHHFAISSPAADNRGNVGFCDGHAEYYDRAEANRPRHYDPNE